MRLFFIAESDRVSSFARNPSTLTLSDQKELFLLPDNGLHHTRSLLLLPPPALLRTSNDIFL
jgi:hypothetical protein